MTEASKCPNNLRSCDLSTELVQRDDGFDSGILYDYCNAGKNCPRGDQCNLGRLVQVIAADVPKEDLLQTAGIQRIG